MIRIEFLSQETQNAIYCVAHKYEGFEILDINDLVKSFYTNIEIKGICGFGLEQAISDYLLFNNDFSKDGRYHYIIEQYQGENRVIKNIEVSSINNDIIDDDYIDELFKDYDTSSVTNNNPILSVADIDEIIDNTFE